MARRVNLLPSSDEALVVRTDFSDDSRWEEICSLISTPVEDWGEQYYARVRFLNDLSFCNAKKEQFIGSLSANYDHSFVFMVDSVTISRLDSPILVIDLYTEVGREFRALPRTIQAIENNLSIANMDFREFADSIDSDGIFRDFY
jgi:hypothetical protein